MLKINPNAEEYLLKNGYEKLNSQSGINKIVYRNVYAGVEYFIVFKPHHKKVERYVSYPFDIYEKSTLDKIAIAFEKVRQDFNYITKGGKKYAC